MAQKIVCNAEDLTAIADAVRASNGSTNTYNVPELSAAAVNAIEISGSSVQADWSVNDQIDPAYVKNRTHYDGQPLFDITWDGVIGDRFALDMSSFGFEGVYFVKVDNKVPTFEELIESVIEVQGEDYQDVKHINAEDCDSYTYPGAYDIQSYVIVCYDADILSTALGLPTGVITNGIYFYTRPEDNHFVTSFTGRKNSKKLEVKYLPDGYPYELEPKFNIIWNGDMNGRTVFDMTPLGYDGVFFVKISDIVLSKEDVINSSYVFNWSFHTQVENVTEWIISDTYPGTYDIHGEIVVVYDQDILNSTFGLPEDYLTNGVYFVADPTRKIYVARFTSKTEVYKLDEKYLPDDLTSNLAEVAKTGDYNDLINKPDISTVSGVVRFDRSQSLTDSQKAQARANLGIDVYNGEVEDV